MTSNSSCVTVSEILDIITIYGLLYIYLEAWSGTWVVLDSTQTVSIIKTEK